MNKLAKNKLKIPKNNLKVVENVRILQFLC